MAKHKKHSTSRAASAAGSLRQWAQPAPFRIAPGLLPPSVLSVLDEPAVGAPPAPPGIQRRPAAPPAAPPLSNPLRFVCDVGNGLWRLRRLLVAPGKPLLEAEPLEGMERMLRRMIQLWDAIEQDGLKIQDHTGIPFVQGTALSAVAFEPRPGLRRDWVIDTVRPTLYLNGVQIQQGEVVVGIPESTRAAAASPEPPPPPA